MPERVAVRLVAVGLLLLCTACGHAVPDGAIVLDRAEWLPEDRDGAPRRSDARDVTLPDDLDSRGVARGPSWYRFRFLVDGAEKQEWAIYFPALHAHVQVNLNGVAVFESGAMDGAQPRGWNVARVADLPADVLREGENEMWVRVGGRPAWFIAPPVVGERAALNALQLRRIVGTAIAPMILAAMMVLIGLFVVVLWLHQKGESLYGYFGVATLLWGIHTAWKVMPVAVFPSSHNLVLWTASYALWVSLYVIFFIRYTGQPHPRFTRFLWGFGLAGFPVLYLSDVLGGFGAISEVWRAAAIGTVFAGLVVVTRFAWRERRSDGYLLLFTASVAALFAVHDWWIAHSGTDLNPVWLVPYAGIAFLLLFGWLIANRFNRDIDLLAAANAELTSRVEQKSAEVLHHHEQLATIEKQQAAEEARDRLLRDMHDGLGAKLMISLRSLERGDIDAASAADLVQQCIDELQLTVDSTAGGDGDLATLLATLRYRLEDKLEKAGLMIVWRVDDTPPIAALADRGAPDLLRIVQEFLNNSLRHAAATMVTFHTCHDAVAGVVSLTLADNGKGFDTRTVGSRDQGGRGHGLANMHERARRLGAEYELSSGMSGTIVRMTWTVRHRDGFDNTG